MNGSINAARELATTHRSDVETFKSGDFGFLGNADDGQLVFYRGPRACGLQSDPARNILAYRPNAFRLTRSVPCTRS
jgi:L-asparaginase/Glu-tRNA(Gln) amidotransferase subunit D